MISIQPFDFNSDITPYEFRYILNADDSVSHADLKNLWNTKLLGSKDRYLQWVENWDGWKLHRYDIINHLIQKYNYVNYLEIGVNDGSCFKEIKAEHKDGVDPNPVEMGIDFVNYKVTSDEFFGFIDGHDIKYDIIFVDGLHYDFQVYRDIVNSLNHLSENGTILCHDMNPLFEVTQLKRAWQDVGQWNGDCWKAWAKLRTEPRFKNLSMNVVNTDHGVGIIRKGSQKLFDVKDYSELNVYDGSATYELLDNNRDELLNLISIEEFYTRYD